MSEPTDDELVDAYLAAAPGAKDALLDRYLPEVLQWCTRLGSEGVDAEDAAQDVLIVLLTRVDGLRDRSRLRSWLFGVTRRTLLAHGRRAWIRRWVPLLPGLVASDRSAQHALELDETGRRVQAVLDRMPRPQREVLVLCDLEERTAAEVGALLEVPLGTVKSRLRLARERFRELAHEHDLAPVRPCEEGS